MQMVAGIERMESITSGQIGRMYVSANAQHAVQPVDEVGRNKKILTYLVKNPLELAMIFDNLEHAGVLYGEHMAMVERFKQMLKVGISHGVVIGMLKDFAAKAPQFFALIVSMAVYRLHK